MKEKNISEIQLKKTLYPASVAVIGATDTPGKAGEVITDNLLNGDYIGRVVPVNPNRREVFGRPTVKRLSDAGDPVDCAIVAVPARAVLAVVSESVSHCRNFVIISAGFSESGSEGKERQEELAALAERYGLTIMGPNCLGFINPSLKLNASFAGGMPKPGKIALLSQSGALAVAMMDRFVQSAHGFSLVASLGNKMQLNEVDLLEFLLADKETRVIGIYSENIQEGERFAAAAARGTHRKPIILLNGGRTEVGYRATASHTGALMQSDEIVRAVCDKSGVWRARDIQEFEILLRFADIYGPTKIEAINIVTNAGGPGVLAADACAEEALPLSQPTREVKLELADKLPRAASLENPIDVLGDAPESRYEDVLSALSAEKERSGSNEAALVVLTPQENTPVMKVAQVLVAHGKCSDMPLAASFVGGERVREAVSYLERSGVVCDFYPEAVARAFSNIFRAGKNRYGSPEENFAPDEEKRLFGQRLLRRARDEKRQSLYFSEASRLSQLHGLPVVRAWRMDYDSPREVEFPCAVKVDSPQIIHKTDRKGVVLNVDSPEKLTQAVEDLGQRFPGERVIVQPMVASASAEMIVGSYRDESFGPVVLVGLGGIFAEQIDMKCLLVPPFDAEEARRLLTDSRLNFIFSGARGQKPLDVSVLARAAVSLGEMMLTHEWIKEIDVNPLLVKADDGSALAVDIKILL